MDITMDTYILYCKTQKLSNFYNTLSCKIYISEYRDLCNLLTKFHVISGYQPLACNFTTTAPQNVEVMWHCQTWPYANWYIEVQSCA